MFKRCHCDSKATTYTYSNTSTKLTTRTVQFTTLALSFRLTAFLHSLLPADFLYLCLPGLPPHTDPILPTRNNNINKYKHTQNKGGIFHSIHIHTHKAAVYVQCARVQYIIKNEIRFKFNDNDILLENN